jgi:predicted dehydrogenase
MSTLLHPIDRPPPVRVMLIGPGKHAEEHLLPAIRQIPDAHLVCICARSDSTARAAALRWGVDYWATDWRSLLNRSFCDAVIVPAVPSFHADVAEIAFEQEVSVFVEKPPAPDTTRLQSLVALERSTKSIGFVGFNLLFSESLQKLISFAKQHGQPRFIKIRCVSNKPTRPLWDLEKLDRSILLAVGIHAISLSFALCESLEYHSSQAVRITSDTTALTLSLRSPTGTTAHLDFGNYSSRLILDIDVITSDGTFISLNDLRHFNICSPPHLPIKSPMLDQKELVSHNIGGLHNDRDLVGYLAEMRSFITSVRDHKPSQVPFARALQSYLAIDHMIRDAELGENLT